MKINEWFFVEKRFDMQVVKSCELVKYLLDEYRLRMTDMTNLDFNCPSSYSKRIQPIYEAYFTQNKFETNFFRYKENLDCLLGASILVSCNSIHKNFDLIGDLI